MKKLTVFLMFGLLALGHGLLGQTTIYSESFTGQNGKGAVGPAPTIDLTGVTWSVDVSSASLTATSDWFQVQNEIFEARDIDGDAIWLSPSIDISAYTGVSFSLDAAENGSMEASDIFNTEYRIDGGAWTAAATNGSLNDDFTSAVVSQSGLSGSSLEIRVTMNNGASSEYHRLDNVLVQGTAASGPGSPQAFVATASGTSQINLTATANVDGDNVLVIFNTSNTFGTPSGTYTAGDAVSGGGTVHFVGAAASLGNHTGLNANTEYFYQAFSFDGVDYSAGNISQSATTLQAEASNHASTFAAAANGAFQIDLSWNDNDGAVAADGFLIVGKTGAGTFAAVADATAVSDDSDWSDNNFALNVSHGTQVANITGLNPSTSYDFEIYPYTNSGSNIDYKTSATVPTASASTTALPIQSLDYTIDMTSTDPFSDNWTAQSVGGSEAWSYVASTGAQMNAFNGGCQANEDWLISPGFNLSATSGELLSFTTSESFTGTNLEVLYSVNYSGTGDPNSAAWTTITTINSGASGTTSNLTNLQGLGSSPVYVAFRYTFSSGSCSQWTVSNFSLVEGSASSNSDINTVAISYTSDIPYANFSAANTLTNSNAVKIAEFQLRDGGGSSDADSDPTSLTGITFTVAGSDNIAALAIFEGDGSANTNLSELTSISSSTAFSGLNISAADNSNSSFSVYATFKSSVTDNERVQLTISSVTANATGSLFAAADGGGATTSTTNQENQIEVSATSLSFNVQPSSVQTNTAISPTVEVEAVDANSNRDLDYTSSVSMTTTGSFNGSSTNSSTPVSGLASFNNLQFASTATGITITAASGGLSNAVSNTFDVTGAVQSTSTTSINFDTGGNWTGNGTVSSYGQGHVYAESNWSFTTTAGDALRNTTSAQDGFPAANGTYSWRLRNNSNVVWTATYTAALAANELFSEFGFSARRWDASPSVNFLVEYSLDGGNNWTTATSIGTNGLIDNAGLANSSDWSVFTQSISSSTGLSANQLVIRVSAQGTTERLFIDDFTAEVSTVAVSGFVPAPTNLSISGLSASSFDVSWTKPSGTHTTDWDGVLVFVSDGSNGISLSASGLDGVDYTANLAYSSGTFATDAGASDNAYCVANQLSDANGSITVTGLSTGTTYYVYAYAYKTVANNSDNDDFSSQVNGGNAAPANLPSAGDIVITEIMYNSSNSGSDDEWIEIYNNSGSSISMDGSWRLVVDGNNFDFGTFTFNNGSYYTIAVGSGGDGVFNTGNTFTPDTNTLNVNNSAVASTSISNNLTNSTDPISIVYDPSGSNITIDAVTYDDGAPWPTEADGAGPSLTLKDPASDNSLAASWRASFGTGGTPGADTVSALEYSGGSWNVTDAPNSRTGNLNANVAAGQSVSITSAAAVKDLSIQAGASLTISTGEVLTVNGDINNANSVQIETAGILLQTKASNGNTGAGNYTVNRTFTPYNQTRFSMWSSPVSNANIEDVFSASNSSDLYQYVTGTGWSAYSSGVMNAGQGYAATPSLNSGINYSDTRVFTGTINNGDVSITVNNASASDYILLGNPYPSGLDFSAFAADHSDILPTAYYWDASPGNSGDAQYASWNASGQVSAPNSNRNAPTSSIRAMQGFFVQVDPSYSGGGTINFTFQNDMRLGSGNTDAGFFKTETRERVWLNLSTDSAANQILVMLDNRATNGFDRMFDAPIYKANQYHSFYSKQDSLELSIQGLPYVNPGSQSIIPLGVDAWYQGVYSISIDSLNNWDANNGLYLVDSLLGLVMDLKQQDYNFVVNTTGTIHNRLYLLFGTPQTIGLNGSQFEKFFSYQDAKGNLVVKDISQLGLNKIELFDMRGQMVLEKDLNAGDENHSIGTESLSHGVYMIHLVDRKGGNHQLKIMIKK